MTFTEEKVANFFVTPVIKKTYPKTQVGVKSANLVTLFEAILTNAGQWKTSFSTQK
jgi:hypothetical protein